eukprot:15475475-Alexandrium_andersonii.AAC.1
MPRLEIRIQIRELPACLIPKRCTGWGQRWWSAPEPAAVAPTVEDVAWAAAAAADEKCTFPPTPHAEPAAVATPPHHPEMALSGAPVFEYNTIAAYAPIDTRKTNLSDMLQTLSAYSGDANKIEEFLAGSATSRADAQEEAGVTKEEAELQQYIRDGMPS